MERDNIIFDSISKENNRQLDGIELIASENFVSNQVMEAMGSCLTNKYAEGLPGKRYYGGCKYIDEVEQLAINRIKQLFNAQWANVQPHSGAQANAAVMLAVLKPGDTILGLDLSHGGHLTHGSLVNYSGILYKPVAYQVDAETGTIDYNMMEKLAVEHRPKLIIAGWAGKTITTTIYVLLPILILLGFAASGIEVNDESTVITEAILLLVTLTIMFFILAFDWNKFLEDKRKKIKEIMKRRN